MMKHGCNLLFVAKILQIIAGDAEIHTLIWRHIFATVAAHSSFVSLASSNVAQLDTKMIQRNLDYFMHSVQAL